MSSYAPSFSLKQGHHRLPVESIYSLFAATRSLFRLPKSIASMFGVCLALPNTSTTARMTDDPCE